MKIEQYEVDCELLSEYEQKYNGGVSLIKRKEDLRATPKWVNVYVDGRLTGIPVDMFNRLIDSGFYILMGRKSF